MGITVTMPQLGESVTEGTIARWLKQPGEAVKKYESLAEVITDKVNAEIPAPADGTMGQQLVAEGTVVPVGGEICLIDAEGAVSEGSNGAAPHSQPSAPAPAAVSVQAPTAAQPPAASRNDRPPATAPAAGAAPGRVAQPVTQVAARAEPADAPPPSAVPPPATAAASEAATHLHVTPAVRMLAREHGIDLTQVSGNGIGGRITKKDVLEYVQTGGQLGAPARPAAAPTPSPARPAPATAAPVAPVAMTGSDTLAPLTPMRRAIAEHMVRSKQTSPHAWTMVEVDMTRVMKLRTSRRAAFRERTGVDLSLMPIVARSVIQALRQHPNLNATWTDEGVVQKSHLNLGVAVGLDDGLIVPVVQNADHLSVTGLASAIGDLIGRARAGTLRLEDIQGGTFTLNNTGALGTVLTQPIINQPQAAILNTDAIVKRAVVIEDDAIAVRSMMNLCISFDHRINDGVQAARFVRTVKELLENIDPADPLM